MISDNHPITMDKETAKEIEDLQNNLKALVSRKRKREDATLEHEYQQLKAEIQERIKDQNFLWSEIKFFKDRLDCTVEELSLAVREIEKLTANNKHLENRLEQQVLSRTFLQRSHRDEKAQTAKAHTKESRLLEAKNKDLQDKLDELQKYKVASQKAVSDLKKKRRLEMDAEFQLLVSHCIQSRCHMDFGSSNHRQDGI
jgi:hypothetical protein